MSYGAQINLFLRITARRDDGYHDLASLFHVIDFGDMIKFSKAPTAKDSITTNHPDVPLDDSNLIIKVRMRDGDLSLPSRSRSVPFSCTTARGEGGLREGACRQEGEPRE
jgi:hypothetical protein